MTGAEQPAAFVVEGPVSAVELAAVVAVLMSRAAPAAGPARADRRHAGPAAGRRIIRPPAFCTPRSWQTA